MSGPVAVPARLQPAMQSAMRRRGIVRTVRDDLTLWRRGANDHDLDEVRVSVTLRMIAALERLLWWETDGVMGDRDSTVDRVAEREANVRTAPHH